MKKEHRNWVVLENILFTIVFTSGSIWLVGGPKFMYMLSPVFYTDIWVYILKYAGTMAVSIGIVLYVLHIIITGSTMIFLFMGIFKLCDVPCKDGCILMY